MHIGSSQAMMVLTRPIGWIGLSKLRWCDDVSMCRPGIEQWRWYRSTRMVDTRIGEYWCLFLIVFALLHVWFPCILVAGLRLGLVAMCCRMLCEYAVFQSNSKSLVPIAHNTAALCFVFCGNFILNRLLFVHTLFVSFPIDWMSRTEHMVVSRTNRISYPVRTVGYIPYWPHYELYNWINIYALTSLSYSSNVHNLF